MLDLPQPFYKSSQVTFKEVPLFAIMENHAKLCMGNLAAMSQLCLGIQDYLKWLVESMDYKLDISSYGGSSSPGDRIPTVPVAHSGTIREQLVEDLTSEQHRLKNPSEEGSSIMLDLLCNIRDAMELLQSGLLSSMEYNSASIVAAKNHGRKMVLNHSTQTHQAELKEKVINSRFNDPGLFGDMPELAMCLFL